MRVLRKGSTGDDVKRIQRVLGVTVDGIFGTETEQALKQFQRKKGITVDGIFGNQSYQAMFGHLGNTNNGGGGSSTSSTSFSTNGIVETVIGGILIYGIFKVVMKVF